MLLLNLQLFGGRGSSSGVGGGSSSSASTSSTDVGNTFGSEAEFEKSLSGFDDPRLEEYTEGAQSVKDEFGDMNWLKENAKNNGLSDWSAKALESDKKQLQNELDKMPDKKTPSELGREAGIKEQIKGIDEVLSYKDVKPKSPVDDVNIID